MRTLQKLLLSLTVVGFLALAAACNGFITDAGATGGPDPSVDPDPDPSTDPSAGACADGICLGASGQTRLTREQYANAVRQLFGADIDIDVTRLPSDHEAGPFASNEDVPATERDVDMYADIAQSIAAQAVEDASAFLPCDPAGAEAECAVTLIREVTPLAYRRPLLDEEEAAYTGLLHWVLEEGTFDEALLTYVETVLSSPNFLYRIEAPAEGEPTRLDGYAIATRLSFYLYGEGPDAELMDAATRGELDDVAGVEAHARRMVEDPRADRAIGSFHREWLGLGELDTVTRNDTGYDAALANAMREETERFARAVVRGDGTLSTLMTARWSIIDARLAEHYGVDAPASGFGRVEMEERSGILTAAGVLTVHATETFTRPVYRGLFVRKRLLCQELPAPPAGALDAAAEAEDDLAEDLSERERLEAITMVGACAGCHEMMNPVGYGLEAFDALGRFRTTDATGALVDIGGSISSESEAYQTDADGEVVGAHALGARLGESDDVARCVSRQWLRFALQRKDVAADEGSVDAAYGAFAESGWSIPELMVAIATTDAFLHRVARTAR
jgi:hypothetical protein